MQRVVELLQIKELHNHNQMRIPSMKEVSSKPAVDKGGSAFCNSVFQKSNAVLVKLQCISELYTKNVVNTFFKPISPVGENSELKALGFL